MRRCALRSCGRFFVAVKQKGPARLYCSEGHASQDRTAAMRSKVSIEDWRRRPWE
jgi:hypothetical protein